MLMYYFPYLYTCSESSVPPMERIRLSSHEKQTLRLLLTVGSCPPEYPRHTFCTSIYDLELKGLVKGAWDECGKLIDARLTERGKTYLALNPSLHNPIDWKWLLTIVLTLISITIATVAIFLACSK